MIRPMDLMEPEETVGNLWHDYASRVGAAPEFPDQAVRLDDMRASIAVLFRALGGDAAVEIAEAAETPSRHRLGLRRKLGTVRERDRPAGFDGQSLRLPPVMQAFPDRDLNRTAYLWLAATAALSEPMPPTGDAMAQDLERIAAMLRVTARVLAACPGLARPYAALCRHLLDCRVAAPGSRAEAWIEAQVRRALGEDAASAPGPRPDTPRGYAPFAPVPIWLVLTDHTTSQGAAAEADETGARPATTEVETRKQGKREDREEADRKDSLIIHRFEAILSWVESLNINRSVDDDDDENAKKAAEDQDHITLSKNARRTATRLRLHLDLSPQDADHERLAGRFTYPEWNRRSRSYMPDHCVVLDAEATPDPEAAGALNPRHMRAVRRQFEVLHPRRILRPRQIEGSELDLDALIAARVDLLATGRGSDRIYQSLRTTERDLSVAILMDCSRSTESAVGDTSVIEVARASLAALAGGIDAAGDRLGIWGFSSLRRDRVFVNRCKTFEEPMTPEVTARICGLEPGHYTRLGAAIRHVSAQLAQETVSKRLLLVLTDGKPNDLDHYEGGHGIEDSHMAVREARRLGQAVHGIVIDADGQDWFARIFGRTGFNLLTDPARLPRALPDIYRTLTEES